MAQRFSALYVVSALLATSSLLASAALVYDPDPLVTGAAGLVAIGLLLYTLIAVAGILLARAPWARWLGVGVTIGALVVIAIAGFDSASKIAALAVSLVAVAGLAGPWLSVWLRQKPGPEPQAVALPLTAVGAPLAVGLAAWSGLTIGALVVAALGPFAAWGYARSFRWGLWFLRIGYPLVAAAAALQLSAPAAILLAGHGIVVALLAWTRQASRAQRPTATPLPEPRHRKRTS